MQTQWNYTDLAKAYLKRADYAPSAINEMIALATVEEGDAVCDVGAGVGHLTRLLAKEGLDVTAVEPNDAMRGLGIEHSPSTVKWFEGTGEETGREDKAFKLVTFGSSFNVTDRAASLKETSRILVPNGWFACMWNHRNLEDDIQKKIEDIIKSNIPDYSYGSRREDQTKVIEESNLFGPVKYIEGDVSYSQTIDDVVEAWRSHATLERQAGDKFTKIVDEIESYLRSSFDKAIDVAYTTRIWAAQLAS